MNKPRILVDFNEMIEENLVLLSKEDIKSDSDGNLVQLFQGLLIDIYAEDVDDFGKPDKLLASGTVESNAHKVWGEQVRWCCRIDKNGVNHESELRKK